MKSIESKIWDLPTRLLHWIIALCITLNLFVLEDGDLGHRWIGYISVFAFSLRFFWGFFGGNTSRFKLFPLHPKQTLAFIRNLVTGKPEEHYPGHNPLATWVYIAIWSCIVCLGVSGWMMGLDAYWGEEWLENLHEAFAKGIQALLILHLLGIALDSFKHRRKTWLGMITGKKY